MAKSKWSNTPISNYDNLAKAIKKDARSREVTYLLLSLGKSCLTFLSELDKRELNSRVSNKEYFSFVYNNAQISRAVNKELFQEDQRIIKKFLMAVDSNGLKSLTSTEINKACYTLTISFACVIDLINRGDKKTPATYFEYLVIHLLTHTLKTDVASRVAVKVDETEEISLTLDLVLDLGEQKPKYHIAIKNSTRERGSEFWAHQRILENAYPSEEERFIGIFIGLAETKLDHRKYEVVEICVPNQWRIYQKYISKIWRIYYLDPPDAYIQLNNKSPKIIVKQFGEFFFETDKLI